MCVHDPTYASQARVRLAHGDEGFCDPCIAPLVQALNDGGFQTVASCCGHGHRPGWIALEDGRNLLVMANLDEARKVEHLWPLDIHGNAWPPHI